MVVAGRQGSDKEGKGRLAADESDSDAPNCRIERFPLDKLPM
jgi:hypothetical protein